MRINQISRYIIILLLGIISFLVYHQLNNRNDGKIGQKVEKTGIIGAMNEEVALLKEKMKLDSIYHYAGLEFYEGKLGGQSVIIVRSGIGKVNAASAAQILIDRFSVNKIINTGVAGALNDTLKIADIVIGKSVQYHDFDVTKFGYKKGIIPRMKTSVFKTDKNLREKVLQKGQELGYRISLGKILSGDQFADEKQKRKIKQNMGGDAVEMEGAAIGHVCYLNKIPFVVIRAISDRTTGKAPKDYKLFKQKAAMESAQLILESLKN